MKQESLTHGMTRVGFLLSALAVTVALGGCSLLKDKKSSGSTEVTIPAVPSFIASTPKNGKKLFIHYKTNFEHDDADGCVAFNVAFGALAQGYEVEMFYDAGGVYDLKVESDGTPHSYGYAVPAKLKSIMADLYPITSGEMPNTYRDYLYWLHTMGATTSYNGFMAALVSLQDDAGVRSAGIEKIAEPISVSQMLQHREAADEYLVY